MTKNNSNQEEYYLDIKLISQIVFNVCEKMNLTKEQFAAKIELELSEMKNLLSVNSKENIELLENKIYSFYLKEGKGYEDEFKFILPEYKLKYQKKVKTAEELYAEFDKLLN